jgi:hypothetical protein
MRPPPNWWSLTGLILNFVGTIVLLWYSKQWLSITPAGSLRVTFGTWATSPWWWYAGLGLNILGFLCQLISNICGVTRRAPPQTASRFPFRWCGTKPTVSGISQLDEPRCGVEQGYSPQCLKTKVLISADLRRSDTVDLRPHWRKQNGVCAILGEGRRRGASPQIPPPQRPSLSRACLSHSLVCPRIQHVTGSHGSPREGLRCRPGRWRKDTVAQEVDPGSPIGLPFDQFQPMDKPFRWSIAPEERQPGAYGGFILEQSLHEGS